LPASQAVEPRVRGRPGIGETRTAMAGRRAAAVRALPHHPPQPSQTYLSGKRRNSLVAGPQRV
jgi:hypothetical protein